MAYFLPIKTRYKQYTFNSLVRQNIEILLNSSINICSWRHKDKNEEFFGEFLELQEKSVFNKLNPFKKILRNKLDI